MTEDKDIKIERDKGGSAGISIERAEGEIAPPLTEERLAEEERPPEEQIAAKKIVGKMPLLPGVVKPPLRFEGQVLAEITGYPGWMYTEEDLEDIATLIAECGIEADPRLQVVIALLGLHAAKFTAYVAWRRTGRKGDIRSREAETGTITKTERPPEEAVRL